jgi:hypothetical protein
MTHAPACLCHHARAFCAALFLVPACVVPGDVNDEPMEIDDTDAPDPNVVFDSGGTTDPDGSDVDSGSEGTSATSGEDTGCNFICPDDDGGPLPDCDPWSQDCPEGEKCMPWSNDGGPAWNSLRCAPLNQSPKQIGDACTAEGGGLTGLDDCDVSLMCWDTDENGQGICVPMCTGSADAPICEDPNDTCVIANDGVLNLCLPKCDPILQDCGEGDACYPTGGNFACAPDASGPDVGGYASPCEYTNACDAGLFCAAASAVPGCTGSAGCCSEYCETDVPDPDSQCQGNALGQICEPWYAEGAAPPGFESVGACLIPQ